MGNLYGHWVDLKGLSFSDDGGTWIQALPLGTYEHPVYGTIEVTPEKVQQFAANVAAKVRGQDLDIDYDHKATEKVAAGWVRAADARADGLWLQVEWTERAKKHLEAKEYRYFSPEFQDEWTHPKLNKTFKNVLFGGALTNRPFLKDILPINLSEMMMADENKPPGGGGGNTPPGGGDDNQPDPNADAAKVVKEVAKLIGLDGASPDQLLGALQVKLGLPGNTDPNDPNDPDKGDNPEGATEPPAAPPAPVAANEGGKVAGIQLSEEDKKNPTIVALAEAMQRMEGLVTTQGTALKSLSEKNRELEAEATLNQFSEGNVVLSPAAKEQAKTLMLSEKSEDRQKALDDLLKAVATGSATVELGERGHARSTAGGESPVKKFNEAVAKYQKDNDKMSYSEAVTQVGRDNPDLQLAYLEAIRNGVTV